jgi:hypothetical protein
MTMAMERQRPSNNRSHRVVVSNIAVTAIDERHSTVSIQRARFAASVTDKVTVHDTTMVQAAASTIHRLRETIMTVPTISCALAAPIERRTNVAMEDVLDAAPTTVPCRATVTDRRTLARQLVSLVIRKRTKTAVSLLLMAHPRRNFTNQSLSFAPT